MKDVNIDGRGDRQNHEVPENGGSVGAIPESTERIQAIQRLIDSFLRSSRAILSMHRAMLPMHMIRAMEKASLAADILDTLQVMEVDGKKSISINDLGPSAVDKLIRDVHSLSLQPQLLLEGALMSLFAAFDALAGGLYRICLEYGSAGSILNSRTVSFAELQKAGSIRTIHEQLLNDESESFTRKSYKDQFDFLKKTFKVPFKFEDIPWQEFIEASQRRHLLVHNDGIISQSYVRNCLDAGYKFRDGKMPEIGSRIGVGGKYLTRAVEVCLEVGLKLTIYTHNKIFPNDERKVNDYLFNIVYRFVDDEQYQLAIRAGAMLIRNGADLSDETRRKSIINVAQSHKWSGDQVTADKLVDDEDWSSCDKLYQLGVACIKGDNDLAIELMKLIGRDEELKEGYAFWPLFNDVRRDPRFSEVYTEVYGEALLTMDDVASYINAKIAYESKRPHREPAETVSELNSGYGGLA